MKLRNKKQNFKNIIITSPGPIWTPLGRSVNNDRLFHDWEEMIKVRAPNGRIGNAEEVANLASFLASDDSLHITGVNILIDGGLNVESKNLLLI